MTKVFIIGQGYVGLTVAKFAAGKYQVIGFDNNEKLVDQLNAHYSEQSSLQINDITRTTNSIHFYDSIVVFEKKTMIPPSSKMMGKWSFEYDIKKKTFLEKIKFHALVRMNKTLQSLKLKGISVNEMLRLSSKK